MVIAVGLVALAPESSVGAASTKGKASAPPAPYGKTPDGTNEDLGALTADQKEADQTQTGTNTVC